MKPRLLSVGVLMLLMGSALSLFIFIGTEMMNAVPLEVPLVLSAGSLRTPEFRTYLSLPYTVEIAFDTTHFSGNDLDCLIGVNIQSVEPCSNEPQILRVKWQLQNDSRTQRMSLYGAGYSFHKVELYVGRFDSTVGGKYKLRVDVLQDATRLASARPRLRVVPFLDPYEGELLLGGLAIYVGVAAALCGAILSATSAFRRARGPV
jgi:hypothetical protein